MQREINGITYTLRNSGRGRRVVISVRSGGEVVVSKSPRVTLASVERLMRERWAWLTEKVREQRLKPAKLLGHYSVKDFKVNKEKARELTLARLTYFNQFYNFKFNRVFIRNQKSRWGSCSSRRNLSFNYKIIFLPPPLADYLIVHELCHLGQMNHSPNFWHLVALQIPDYKKLRRELKLY